MSIKLIPLRQSTTGGPVLVFIHGWGATAEVWRPLSASLPGTHYALELPGFGGSAEEPALELDKLLDTFAELLPKNSVLVGWSLGGMLAVRLAAQQPGHFAALITLAANPCFTANEHWPSAMAQDTFRQFVHSFAQSPEKTFNRFCILQSRGDENAKLVQQTLRQLPAPQAHTQALWAKALSWLGELDNRALYKKTGCPQLHIFGNHDALVPVQAADAVAALVPQATIKKLHQTAHCLPVSAVNDCAVNITHFLNLPEPIQKQKIARSFSAAAETYDSAANIQQRIGAELLDTIPQERFERALDLGCGTGYLGRHWPQRKNCPHWLLHGDLAEGMLQVARRQSAVPVLAMDAEQIPLAERSVDLAVSSLTLQWCTDLPSVFSESFRILRPGGVLACATLLPGTLQELKSAWQAVDGFTHVNPFASKEAVLGGLEQAGFAVELCQSQPHIDWHPDLFAVLKSLKAIGAHNMNQGANPGLTTRARLARLQAAYEPHRAVNGKLPATYQVLYFVVRKPHE